MNTTIIYYIKNDAFAYEMMQSELPILLTLKWKAP